MASPEYELVGKVLSRLLAYPALQALIGPRAYYRAPANAVFPYVTTEDTDKLRADATCISGAEIYMRVHVYARDGNPLQIARQIAHEVENALHGHALDLPSNELIVFNHRQTQAFYDPDGLTGHGVVEFRAITHAPA
ncbi:MAG TPA: DUF3168 domain-containing protein [Rhizobiaceae bacterium]|nr:DUF3168 domain-containing protein [Rhizobiaceae bacterium]